MDRKHITLKKASTCSSAMEIFWTALTVGALGSFHCVGMCGPIALALPLDRSSTYSKVAGGITYNLGRVLTYATMGALFGLLGRGFAMVATQQYVSIGAGILIIISVALPAATTHRFMPTGLLTKQIMRLKSAMGNLLRQKSYSSLLLIGVLNGFLPCGVVYLAIAGAIATGTPAAGSLFMVFFGLGTIPVMLMVVMLGNLLSLKVRGLIRKSVPIVMLCIGLLFIARGMDLGIPYLSPKIQAQQVLNCCQ